MSADAATVIWPPRGQSASRQIEKVEQRKASDPAPHGSRHPDSSTRVDPGLTPRIRIIVMSLPDTRSPRPSSVRAAASAASRVLRRARRLSVASPGHPDAALLAACAEYAVLRRRIDGVFKGTKSLADEEERARVNADLIAAGHAALILTATSRAVTLDGHRARAAVFLAWDDGDVVGRARRHGITEDRLLAALLTDLVAG